MGACSSAVSGMGVSSGTSPSCADALASIVGQQKFSAQIIPIWLRHRFTRRRVSPIGVYTIKENALVEANEVGLHTGVGDMDAVRNLGCGCLVRIIRINR